MSILAHFVAILVGGSASVDHCKEYSDLERISRTLYNYRDSLSEFGRKKQGACRHDGKDSSCTAKLRWLKIEIYKVGDSMKVVDDSLQRIHDQCDSLIMKNADSVTQDLKWDVENMWKVQPIEDGGVSSVSSINSAVRVVNLMKKEIGRISIDSFEICIGYRKREKYKYPMPFWPIHGRVRAYRFDTGRMGYQFDVSYGENGVVTDIKKRWIY